MSDDTQKLRVVETITIKKFDGDPPAEGEEKEPVEVVTHEQVLILTPDEFEARYGANQCNA